MEQRNPFAVGDTVEVTGPETETFTFPIEGIVSAEDGTPLEIASHAQQLLWVPVPRPVRSFDLVRRKREQA
ncbi:MAG: U32 family peptidase C-terminal domain-containing protein [bacterium]